MNLNSTLLEGVIVENPEYSEKEKRCKLTIRSDRFYKVGGKLRKKENIFTVIATGKIAECCSKKNKGATIRVTGSLDTVENNAVIIEADHIDYKP